VAVLHGVPGPVPHVLEFPDRFAGPAVRMHGGGTAEVVIPASWREVHKNPPRIRGIRDRNLDELRRWLGEFIASAPESEELLCSPADIARHRSPQFYAVLGAGLRDDAEHGRLPDALRPAYDMLQAFLKQDRHLYQWESHERDQIIGRRNYTFRNVAAWLLQEAAVVVLDSWSVSSLARVPRLGDDEDDGQAQAARSNRMLAAPGRLRELIACAARMRGVTVVTPEGAVPRTCADCGGGLSGDRDAGIFIWCGSCGQMKDQDLNALEHMVRQARGGK
jgi:hypothetical protein